MAIDEKLTRSQIETIPNSDFTIAGVLVVYEQGRDIHASVTAAMNHLDHLFIIDNSEESIFDLSEWSDAPTLTLLQNRNVDGLAGAYNQVLKIIGTDDSDVTHILFLDDDSDASTLGEFISANSTKELLDRPQVAAVAPASRERETRLTSGSMRLSKFGITYLGRDLIGPTPVTFVINSMSLWKLSAVNAIGTYNQYLAVDHIDTDFCLRAKELGYLVYVNPQFEFDHSIGARRAYSVFGITLQAGGHSASRRYQIARNTTLLARHYCLSLPSFTLLCLSRLGYEILGVVMAEDSKYEKVYAILKGIIAGVFASYGKRQVLPPE